MKKENKKNNNGFTLIELLIVVLIIGVLTAVALPGYRKAVERSRVSDALTTMQAIAKSEHGWYLNNNSYTKDFANLDIEINGTINEGALETDFYTYELLDTGILAERNNGDYSLYKDYESSQVLCMPGNHFVCENLIPFTKEPCERVGMAWANTNTTCYANEEARCKGLYDDSLWKGTHCGYNGTSNITLDEGVTCKGWPCEKNIVNNGGVCDGPCQYSTVHNGGKCIGNTQNACNYSTITAGGLCTGTHWAGCRYLIVDGGECDNGCEASTIKNGGVCSGYCQYPNVEYGGICAPKVEGGCSFGWINDGGKCIANMPGSCASGYYGTGCCEGQYCGRDAPKCNCPIDENTGKHKTSC